MDNEKIGSFLKQLRKDKGLSQKDIAEACNVSHQAVSKWEKGESIPDISTLKRLSEYHHLSIDEILSGEPLPDKTRKYDNNRNKEIIKLTMSFFMIFVPLLPFYNDGRSFNGYEMIFEGEFGLGVMTLITVSAFLVFQIIYSIFTLSRVISFSRGNMYLNRSITVIITVLVWFTLTISALNPFPFIVYAIYLISIYIISTRCINALNEDTSYIDNRPRYEPYAYLIFYFTLLSIVPAYLVFFDEWYRDINIFVLPFTIIIHLSAILVIIYGFLNREKKPDLANYCKIVSVHSMRLLYIMFLYLLYTESYFLDFSANSYDGIMYVIVYIGFELLISSKYHQSMKLKGNTVKIFK